MLSLFLTVALIAQTPPAPSKSLPSSVQCSVFSDSDKTAYAPSDLKTEPLKTENGSAATQDPWGFTVWINATRAAYGLHAVGYSADLTGWAAKNNIQQVAHHWMGHWVMGPARRQNTAMGPYHTIVSLWMGSPPHRAALLDPTIRWVGIAESGTYWTFNAN